MIMMFNAKRDLKHGYRGLEVCQNPIRKGKAVYKKEIKIPRALAKQYIQYLENLLSQPRIKGKDRAEMEDVVQQYKQAPDEPIFLNQETRLRFLSFMERIKGRYIEGLTGAEAWYLTIK